MPELTGEELVVEIFKLRPQLPVLVCTGFIDDVIERSLERNGIKHRLAKPLNRDAIASKLREIFEQDQAS